MRSKLHIRVDDGIKGGEKGIDEIKKSCRLSRKLDLDFLTRMHLMFQALDKYKEEAEVMLIVFGRLVVKWQDKIMEIFPIETLSFVNLIDLFKTQERQEKYKGMTTMRSRYN